MEGFYVYEQGVCRYVEGYAQFYEKNDSMLRFMVDDRQEEARPEEFDQSKYDVVKRRQEERRQKAAAQALRPERRGRSRNEQKGTASERKDGMADTRIKQMKMTAAAVFIVLCGAGLATMGGEGRLAELRQAAQNLINGMSEQQIPDAQEVSNGEVQVGTLVTEDKLTDAIRKENEAVSASGSLPETDINRKESTEPAQESGSEVTPEPIQESGPEVTPEPVQESVPEETPEPVQEPVSEATPEPAQESVSEATPEPDPIPAPVSYTIQKGDTLIGICMSRYGSDERVAEICALNSIINPDDIKIGQEILLP